LIDGKALAEKIKSGLKFEGTPGLAVVLVGNDPASELYTRMKVRACEKAGIYSVRHELPEDTPEEKLISLIGELNRDEKIHGILVQIPLPKHIDTLRVMAAVDPKKDVDGFHPLNLGRLMAGNPELVACTPLAIMKLIESTGIRVQGSTATVIGHSIIVGKPASFLLINADATVTTCHVYTKDLASHTKNADIIVSAAGVPGLVKKDMVKPGAVVIDVGISRVGGKVVGDVDPAVAEITEHLTPVPGGVGPVTIACLLENTVKAFNQYN